MTTVSHNHLSEVLLDISNKKAAPVYLLYGDEFLFKSAYKPLVEALIPLPKDRLSNCDVLDGATTSVYDVVERMHTFSLFSGPKVIALLESPIFYSKMNIDTLLEGAKQDLEKQNVKRACRRFLQALGMTGIGIEDVGDLRPDQVLRKLCGAGSACVQDRDASWVAEVIGHCVREQLTVPVVENDADVLEKALLKGLPKGNHLIVTTEMVDRRTRLYKTIARMGVVVDCTFVKGTRTADKRRQEQALKARMAQALKQAGKTTTPGAFEALYERTGADLRTFMGEVEKLIAFVGDAGTISVQDVEKATEKSRTDPVYELSNAIGERDVQKALAIVHGLLSGDLVPIQILSAVVGQVRRLILSKEAITILPEGRWHRRMDYKRFQKLVLPDLQEAENRIFLKNVHPYVIYKSLIHAENYDFAELSKALTLCLDADRRLKTSAQDAGLVLEYLIYRICGPLPDLAQGHGVHG
ncbi:MAG: DNA polymerase III subunit delta [Deltaproteobacteria bacterium]|nr:DNA polymerase III subunit delta [Deltaproteobacteria bacterium]